MPNGGSFQCIPQPLEGVVCFALTGDLDLASVTTFRHHLATAVHRNDGLLLNLQDLRYLDSSGVNALLDIHRAFAPSGRRIALVMASPIVRRILSVLQLEHLMPVFASMDEALAYLRSEGESERPHAGA